MNIPLSAGAIKPPVILSSTSTTGYASPPLPGRNVFVAKNEDNPFFTQQTEVLTVPANGLASLNMNIAVPGIPNGETYLAVGFRDVLTNINCVDLTLTLSKSGVMINRFPLWSTMQDNSLQGGNTASLRTVTTPNDPALDFPPTGFDVPMVNFVFYVAGSINILAIPFRITQDVNQMNVTGSLINFESNDGTLCAGIAAFTL